ATLRAWRKDFAQYLQDFGVEANATERAVRGQTPPHKKDGIYRAMSRHDSRHAQERAESVARDLATGRVNAEPGKRVLTATRRAVLDGWHGVADVLEGQGSLDLSRAVRRFADSMPPPLTDRERIARQLESRAKARSIEDMPL